MLMRVPQGRRDYDGPGSSGPGDLISLQNLRSIIRRRLPLLIATTVAFLMLAAAYVVTTTPLYTATTTLYIDVQNAQMLEVSPINTTQPVGLSDFNVNSQVAIVKSEKIALKVIGELKLQDQPEFSRSQSLIVSYVGGLVGFVREALRFGAPPPNIEQNGIPREVIEGFSKRLWVERVPNTFIISISFASEDRYRAAEIANAVANAYLSEKLESRTDSVQRASGWLRNRLIELGQAALMSDRKVQEFKQQNGIVDTRTGSGQLLTDAQLNDLSARLIEARKETAQKQARLQQIEQMIVSGNPNAAVIDSLDNPVISDLRKQFSAASQRESEIARQYGSTHDAAVRARRQMNDLNELILNEIRRIAQVYRSDLDVARRQEADLRESVAEFTQRSAVVEQAMVRLRDLERGAQADGKLYESFVDRYQTSIQQQSFPITEARVMSVASPPRNKSSPKIGITLVLAGIAGLGLGMALALARELNDRVFRSPSQVEDHLDAPCIAVLPLLSADELSAPRAPRHAEDGQIGGLLPLHVGSFQRAVDAPMSRFSEALRMVKLAADTAKSDEGVRVIGVVSSVPGEGKSTAAMNLGELLAAGGSSVLIIDGDLRSPTLTRALTKGARAGLVEVLGGRVTYSEAVYSDDAKPLQFLPAFGEASSEYSSVLLGSPNMGELLQEARKAYDYVIVDLPPLALVIDAKAVAHAIDGFVFAVEWGKTQVATATQALHDSPLVKQKLIGCLLTKADMKALRLYTASDLKSDYYSYDKVGSYFQQR